MNNNPQEIKKLAKLSEEATKKSKKFIVLPLPREEYYRPGPMVRRNSISGMNPFEKLFAETAREITEDERRPASNKRTAVNQTKPRIDEAQLNQAIQRIQEPSNAPIIAMTEPIPLKPKRGRRKTICGQPLRSKPTKKPLSKEFVESDGFNSDDSTTIRGDNRESTKQQPVDHPHMPNLGDAFEEVSFEFNEIPKTPRPYSQAEETSEFIPMIIGEEVPENGQTHEINFLPQLEDEQHFSRKLSATKAKLLNELLARNSEEIDDEIEQNKQATENVLSTAHEILSATLNLYEDITDEMTT